MVSLTAIDVNHHCAAPTWNGFVYQGKIALIVVLDFLLRDNQSWEGYSLELEWREDFSILSHEHYISIHQVKCKSATGLGEYEEAITKLRTNIYPEEANEAPLVLPLMYLHTAAQIPSIEEEDVRLYEYGDGECFMPIEFVDIALQNRIKLYLDKVDPDNSGSRGEAFYERCLLYVCNIVTAKIQEIHRLNHSGILVTRIPKLISFETIIGFLQKDYNANSQDYYTFRAKQIFNQAFDKFLEENEISEESKNELYVKLCNYTSLINSLSDQNFRRFCFSIFPYADLRTESGYPELPMEAIMDAFCEVLSQISLVASITDNDHKLLYNKGSTNYLASSIITDKKKRVIEGLKKNIYNDAFLEILFQVNIIVSKNVSFISLQDELGHILGVPEVIGDNNNINRREKINQIQKIGMIDLVAAKQRLDTDD